MTRSMLGAVDVGGSHATVAAVELDGRLGAVRSRHRIELDSAASSGDILDALGAAMRRAERITTSWTIALPGPFDYAHGSGGFEGVGKFASLAGVDLRAQLAAQLAPSDDGIEFVNDAVAYGVGEWQLAERPARFVCLTLGTGIGSAFLDRGVAVEDGPDVPPHGWAHLVHLGGRPLEQSVSTSAIRSAYRLAAGAGADVPVAEIADRARRGDDAASAVLASAMRRLGEAVGPWVDRFGATDLVIGGSMARSWDVLAPALRSAFGGSAPRARVRAAAAIDDAPLLGAALWRSARGR